MLWRNVDVSAWACRREWSETVVGGGRSVWSIEAKSPRSDGVSGRRGVKVGPCGVWSAWPIVKEACTGWWSEKVLVVSM